MAESDEEEDLFLSPQRSTKPPARPPGAAGLTGKQDKLAKVAEAVYRKAREQGWTRKRLYRTLNESAGLKGLRQDIKDNLVDHYKAPRLNHLRKTVPPGYSNRSVHQESAIELYNYYGQYFQEDGTTYVIIEDGEGGYQVYVQDDTP